MVLENERYRIYTECGIIRGFFDKSDKDENNIADENGKLAAACFTLKSDDIKTAEHEKNTPYDDRTAVCARVVETGKNHADFADDENSIYTHIALGSDGLEIQAETCNDDISEFGINIDLNFLGKKGGEYMQQYIPGSQYTSADGKYMFCIMKRPDGKVLTAVARTECDGWKIKYSPYASGHFILNYQMLASFDKVYGGSGRKHISVNISCADSVEEAYKIISARYNLPICVNITNGGFDGYARIRIEGEADEVLAVSPSGEEIRIVPEPDTITLYMSEYGMYTVIPIKGGKHGLNTTVWNGVSFEKLFDKSCEAIRTPYHPDENLCEGGCFLWAMLADMNRSDSNKFDEIVRRELDIITGKGKYTAHKTIVPHETQNHKAYHIYNSNRVQEQFFGVSILIEAYKHFGDEEILEYAVRSLENLLDENFENGMIYNGSDYTTVCCPVIAVADMARLLEEKGDKRSGIFKEAAIQTAEFLLKRGLDFPTETEVTEYTEKEREDGSISCTALSLLYVCRYVRYDRRYIDFADKIMKLHEAWSVSVPDCRMNGSSMRWWETLWEGDGDGPAICAGHAWTIWRAEALFYLGILKGDRKALIDSWNGFVTNFSKTEPDGSMYACYEADYIKGGGDEGTRKVLAQLKGEDSGIKYEIAHGYPHHKDNSLSRYAWVRAEKTWMKTAAIINEETGINIRKINGKWIPEKFVEKIYDANAKTECKDKLVALEEF